jgi:outer membrane beta-barrel protein
VRACQGPFAGATVTALLRATIALVVGFALVARWAEAAGSEASPSGPSDGRTVPESDEPGPANTPAPAHATTTAIPEQPFEDGAHEGAHEGADEAGGADSDEDEAPGAPLRALSCLEGEGGNERDGARRGVQKRDFLKRHRFEVAAMGGYYASDALSSTYVYGGSVSFFFSEDFGVEAAVLRNPVSFRLENAFKSFDGQQHFQPGMAWNLLGALVWSPVHAKLRFSEHHITHADLLVSAGGGETLSGTAQGFTWQLGLGLKLYLARFVSLRVDLRDLMIPQEIFGQGRNTHNVAATFGVCGWLPG